MTKCLVTGGAGFIGSHLTQGLVQAGYSVRVLDNFGNGSRENLAGVSGDIEIVDGDVRDENCVLKACEGVEVVFHHAALHSVPESIKKPKEYTDVNIMGTLNLLESSVAAKVRRFIFASSSAVYGESANFPQREKDVPQPLSIYALNKLAGEHYCRVYAQNFELETFGLRYFNVFGERQSLHDEYAGVIPKFVAAALNAEPCQIYGDGGQSRNFVHVGNVVAANILCLKSVGLKHEVFNVAGDENCTIMNLAGYINQALNKNIPPVYRPARPGDIYRSEADISKIKSMLGYEIRIDLRAGLEKTINYFSRLRKC